MISRTQATIWWGLPTAIVFALVFFNRAYRSASTGLVSVEFAVILLSSLVVFGVFGAGAFAKMFNTLFGYTNNKDRKDGAE